MKRLAFACLASLAVALSAAAEWKTDFEAAKTEARKDGKMLLLNFTGSDWCGWCIRMKADTLDKPEFGEFAKKNLVLVEVDFPTRKKLSAEQKKANAGLKDKFAVGGYPTYVITDASGKELTRQIGYLQGGPPAFIKKIEGSRPKAQP